MVDQPENEVTTESEADLSVDVALGQLASGGEFASGEGFGYHGDAAPGAGMPCVLGQWPFRFA
jgi:hypothetical protein